MQLRKRTVRESVFQTVNDVFEPVQAVDMYPKLKRDHVIKGASARTTSGGVVTVVAAVVIALLFMGELAEFMSVQRTDRLLVDPSLGQRLLINFDITFHALHCGEVNLDAMDVAGEQQNGVSHDITKTRLGPDAEPIGSAIRVRSGRDDAPVDTERGPDYCGSCYGAESEQVKCCNTCESLKVAYEAKGWSSAGLGTTEQCKNSNQVGLSGEGCRIKGNLQVNKVSGNLHVAMGSTHARGGRHIHQFNPSQIAAFNASHTIHSMHFGPTPSQEAIETDPLYNKVAISEEGSGVFQYYLKLVPIRKKRKGWFFFHIATDCKYSVQSTYRPAVVNGIRQPVLPGVFWVYDISPLLVDEVVSSQSLTEFVTECFAIVGGVMACAAFANSLITSVSRGGGLAAVFSPKSRADGGGGGVDAGPAAPSIAGKAPGTAD